MLYYFFHNPLKYRISNLINGKKRYITLKITPLHLEKEPLSMKTLSLYKEIILKSLISGSALFSMFFGAGNLIFPLMLGKESGNGYGASYAGIILTGVCLIFLGLVGIALFNGDHHAFFTRIGHKKGIVLHGIILLILGPLTGIPRIISVLHEFFRHYFSFISPSGFIVGTLFILFLFSYDPRRFIWMLSFLFTPLILLSLGALFWNLHTIGIAPTPHHLDFFSAFKNGIYEGYETMDLLASFHFAPLILFYLEKKEAEQGKACSAWIRYYLLGGGVICCLLLCICYWALCYSGMAYSNLFPTQHTPLLFSYFFQQLYHPFFLIFFPLFIMSSLVSTALTLISIFAQFIHEDVLQKKGHYIHALLLTLLLTGFFAHGGYETILSWEKPFLSICYPPLIVLTFCNILYKTHGFKPIKGPVLLTFAFSLLLYIGSV